MAIFWSSFLQTLLQVHQKPVWSIVSSWLAMEQSEHELLLRQKAFALKGIGDSYMSQGNYREALEYYDQGLFLAQDLGDLVYETNILNSIGQCFNLQGNYCKALEYYEQALARLRQARIGFTDKGQDTLEGSSGNNLLNIISYYTSNEGVHIPLQTGRALGNDAEGDRIYGFENVEGSHYNGTIVGSNWDNFPIGLDGNDFLDGKGGNDLLCGGNGDDHFEGREGNDLLYGCDGYDLLDGGFGDDCLDGGAGDDVILGGDSNDILDGGTGQDTVSYQWDSNAVKVYLSSEGAHNGFGRWDMLINIENVICSAFSDWLHGDQYNNIWVGLEGHDTLFGNQSNDVLLGDEGRDCPFGGDDNDELYGGIGNGTLNGGNGNDTLYGQAVDDYLWGESNEYLDGGFDNDLLDGGTGYDALLGGAGHDILDGGIVYDLLYVGFGNVLNGGAGNDFIESSPEADVLCGHMWDDVLNRGSATSTISQLRQSYADFISYINRRVRYVRLRTEIRQLHTKAKFLSEKLGFFKEDVANQTRMSYNLDKDFPSLDLPSKPVTWLWGAALLTLCLMSLLAMAVVLDQLPLFLFAVSLGLAIRVAEFIDIYCIAIARLNIASLNSGERLWLVKCEQLAALQGNLVKGLSTNDGSFSSKVSYLSLRYMMSILNKSIRVLFKGFCRSKIKFDFMHGDFNSGEIKNIPRDCINRSYDFSISTKDEEILKFLASKFGTTETDILEIGMKILARYRTDMLVV